jgi:hypothetical protein
MDRSGAAAALAGPADGAAELGQQRAQRLLRLLRLEPSLCRQVPDDLAAARRADDVEQFHGSPPHL